MLAFSVFEHVKHFWKGFAEVRRVLRPDGVFLVCCPFYFHVHGYPHDYWRFTPEAFDTLLNWAPTRVLGWHGPERRPLNVWAAAFGPEAKAPTAEQYQTYRAKLSAYGKEPVGLVRRLRYRLGRALCGRRPFARLRHRFVGQPDNHEQDFAGGNMNLNIDLLRLDSGKGHCADARCHGGECLVPKARP